MVVVIEGVPPRSPPYSSMLPQMINTIRTARTTPTEPRACDTKGSMTVQAVLDCRGCYTRPGPL